jgi:hypothetical protein
LKASGALQTRIAGITCDILICNLSNYTAEARHLDPLPKSFQDTNCTESSCMYELRYVCFTRITGDSGNKWDGSIFVRHGGAFSSWWEQDRHDHLMVKSNRDIGDFPWANLQVAVYVGKSPMELETLRNKYMSYIGGQSKVHCRTHKIPLIVAFGKGKNPLECCGTDHCKRCKIPSLQFPINECLSNICKPYFQAVEGDDIYYVDGVAVGATQGMERNVADNGVSDNIDGDSETSELGSIGTEGGQRNDDSKLYYISSSSTAYSDNSS